MSDTQLPFVNKMHTTLSLYGPVVYWVVRTSSYVVHCYCDGLFLGWLLGNHIYSKQHCRETGRLQDVCNA